MVTITQVFQNGDGQAMIIPEELRTERTEYCIDKIGEVFIAFPTDDVWVQTRRIIGTFPSDFMSERDQPSWDDVVEREEL